MKTTAIVLAIGKILIWLFLTVVVMLFAGWGGTRGIYEILETIALPLLFLLSCLSLAILLKRSHKGFIVIIFSVVLDILAIASKGFTSGNYYDGRDWLLTTLIVVGNLIFLWAAYSYLRGDNMRLNQD